MNNLQKIALAIIILLALFFLGKYFLPIAVFVPEAIGMIQYQGSLTDERWYQDAEPKPITSSEVVIDKYKFVTAMKEFGQVYGEPYCYDIPNCPVSTTDILNWAWKNANNINCYSGECKECGKQIKFGDGYCGNDPTYYCCDWACGVQAFSPTECYSYLKDKPREYNSVILDCWGRPYGNLCIAGNRKPTKGICLWFDDYLEKRTEDGTNCPINVYKILATGGGGPAGDEFPNVRGCDAWGSHPQEIYCGGQVQDLLYDGTDYRSCWQKVDIYENDKLIKTLEWDTSAYQGRNRLVDLPGLRAMFMYNYKLYEGCRHIDNTFSFIIPPNAFDFEVSSPKPTYFTGEESTVDVTIINNWKDVKAKLSVVYEIPTAIGVISKTESKIIDVPKGSSTHTYSVPTKLVTDKVFLTPKLDIVMDGSLFSGVNGYCYDNPEHIGFVRDLNSCEYVLIGTLSGDKHVVQIIPKPIYIKTPPEGCPEGYEDRKTGYCVRNDLKELTCFQLGCPVIDEVIFECTSSGICSQSVFVELKCKSDSDCEVYKAGTKCDVGSGLCIDEIIFEKILQCKTAVDCPKPCESKTISCIDGKCIYTGECKVTEISCVEVGCPEGFICNEERRVCERTIVKFKIPIYMWVILGVVVSITLYLLLQKKQKT